MVGEVILKYFLLVSTLSLTRDYICNLESSFTLCWGEKMGRILGGGNLLKNEKKWPRSHGHAPCVQHVVTERGVLMAWQELVQYSPCRVMLLML